MVDIRKYTFDSVPQLVTDEGKTILVQFCVSERKVAVNDGNMMSEGEDTKEKKEAKTVYDGYSIRVEQPISRDKVVDAIISSAYPSDRMQAIINNHFLNLASVADGEELDADEQEHEQEYLDMQAWRKKAKETAQQVIEEYLSNI